MKSPQLGNINHTLPSAERWGAGNPQCINFKLGIQPRASLGMKPCNRRLVWLSQLCHMFKQHRPTEGKVTYVLVPQLFCEGRATWALDRHVQQSAACQISDFLTSFSVIMENHGIMNRKAKCKEKNCLSCSAWAVYSSPPLCHWMDPQGHQFKNTTFLSIVQVKREQ